MPSNKVAPEAPRALTRAHTRSVVNIDVAEHYRKDTMPYVEYTDDDGKDTDALGRPLIRPYAFCEFHIKDFLDYGLGVFLYYEALWNFALFFIWCTMLSLPAMIFSGAQDPVYTGMLTTYGIERTYLGNLGTDDQNTPFGWTKEDVGLITSLCDATLAVSAFLFYFYMTRDVAKQSKQYMKHMNVSHFTVEVSGLPVDLNNNQKTGHRQKVAAHFEQLMNHQADDITKRCCESCGQQREINLIADKKCTVVDVAFVHKNIPFIELYKKRGLLKAEIRGLQRKGEDTKAAEEKMELLMKQIEPLQAKYDSGDFDCLVAYVTFEHVQHAVEVAFNYNQLKCLSCAPHLCACCVPRRYKFQHVPEAEEGKEVGCCSYHKHGFPIHVRRAPEPSNIIYNNLSQTDRESNTRAVITGVITLVMIAFSTGVYFYAAKLRNDTENAWADLIESCPDAVSYEEALDNHTLANCYCDSVGIVGAFEELSLCDQFIGEYSKTMSVVYGSSIVVITVNYLLKMSARKMGQFERHRSVSAEEKSIMDKLFLTLFMNTGLLVLILNSQFLSESLSPWCVWDELTEAYICNYPEAVAWYNIIGQTLTTTMVISVFNPHVVEVLKAWIGACSRSSIKSGWDKKGCCKSSYGREKWTTQNELNQAFRGKKFALATRYASILNIIFCVLFYGPAMPAFYTLGFLTMFFMYQAEKYAFLRYFRLPPHYDDALQLEFLGWIPWAVVLHLGASLVFYSSPQLTSSYIVGSSELSLNTYVNVTDSNIGRIFTASEQWNCLPNFMILALFVVFKVLLFLSMFFPCAVCSDVNKRLMKEQLTHFSDHKEYWVAVREEFFESYHLSHNENYVDAYLRTPSDLQLQGYSELVADKRPDLGPRQKGWTADYDIKDGHDFKSNKTSDAASTKGNGEKVEMAKLK